MSERNMRQRVVKALKPLHAISVENHVYPGTPDVNFCEGWIELKQLGKWPKRNDAIVKVDHFRPEQKIWLRHRCRVDGNVYLLLQMARDWLLFRGCVAARLLGKVDRVTLQTYAEKVWIARLDEEDLRRSIMKRLKHQCR